MDMYKMYLVLGDWSNDGHEKSDNILVETNYPVDKIQQAYKDSCKLTGVSFNDWNGGTVMNLLNCGSGLLNYH